MRLQIRLLLFASSLVTQAAAFRDALAPRPLAFGINLEQQGRTFRCTGLRPDPKDEFLQPVRFIESGIHFQRVAIEGLEFADSTGARSVGMGRLELALWPDRMTVTAELEGVADEQATLRLKIGGRSAAVSPGGNGRR
jgi:hypothetical protein